MHSNNTNLEALCNNLDSVSDAQLKQLVEDLYAEVEGGNFCREAWREVQFAYIVRVNKCEAKWKLEDGAIVECADKLGGDREYELTCSIPASAIPLDKIKRVSTNVMSLVGTKHFGLWERSQLAYIGLTVEDSAEYVVIGSCYQCTTHWCDEQGKVEYGANEFEMIIRKQDLAEATQQWLTAQSKPLTQNPFNALSAICA